MLDQAESQEFYLSVKESFEDYTLKTSHQLNKYDLSKMKTLLLFALFSDIFLKTDIFCNFKIFYYMVNILHMVYLLLVGAGILALMDLET
jgi:hypothetical protein